MREEPRSLRTSTERLVPEWPTKRISATRRIHLHRDHALPISGHSSSVLGDWMTHVEATNADLAQLGAEWDALYPDVLPVGHMLGCGVPNWVRFHSLPGSRRYPDDEEQYAELLRRHFTVLETLSGGHPVWRLTCRWSELPNPGSEEHGCSLVDAQARYWRTVRDDADPDSVYWHIYAAIDQPVPARLTELLREVADGRRAGVIIADRRLEWLYHPYDGGADVYARNEAERDALRVAHSDWLSRHPLGL